MNESNEYDGFFLVHAGSWRCRATRLCVCSRGGRMTRRYTFRRIHSYVSGGTCGICKQRYDGKVCPYCTQ